MKAGHANHFVDGRTGQFPATLNNCAQKSTLLNNGIILSCYRKS